MEARRELDFRIASLPQVAAFTTTNRATVDAVDAAAATSGDPVASEAPAALSPLTVVSAPFHPGDFGAVEDATTLDAAFSAATDRGRAQLSGRLADGTVAVVGPRYAAGVDTGTTASRRAGVVGWVVGRLDVAALVGATVGPGDESGVLVSVSDAGVTLAGDPSIADRRGAVIRPVLFGGRTWELIYAPASSITAIPADAWAIAVVGVVLALIIVAMGAQSDRVRRAAAANEADRAMETKLIADLGPVLQQSLDLADILPAVVVRLADEFDCDRMGVSIVGDDGLFTEVFALGGGGGVDLVPARLGPPPSSVAPGEDVVVPLHRAGRTVGALSLRSRVGIDIARMRAVEGACDLLSASVANARLFQREQHTVARLHDLDDLKTAFLGTASHELRTPVAAIRGFAELLDERWDGLSDTQRRDFVSRIAKNAGSLAGLVQDLLDFARLERDAMRVQARALELSPLVRSIAEDMASLTEDHEIRLQLGAEVQAHADPEALTRVVTNLLANATKFAPAGTPVTVTVRSAGDDAVVTVDDAGPGVPDAERERIFSRFYRGGSEEVLRTRGAGIGLAVVRDLVTRMHGSVTVGRSPEGGARFEVRLPVEAPAGLGYEGGGDGSGS